MSFSADLPPTTKTEKGVCTLTKKKRRLHADANSPQQNYDNYTSFCRGFQIQKTNERLAVEIQNGDQNAKEELCKRNRGIVCLIAEKCSNPVHQQKPPAPKAHLLCTILPYYIDGANRTDTGVGGAQPRGSHTEPAGALDQTGRGCSYSGDRGQQIKKKSGTDRAVLLRACPAIRDASSVKLFSLQADSDRQQAGQNNN